MSGFFLVRLAEKEMAMPDETNEAELVIGEADYQKCLRLGLGIIVEHDGEVVRIKVRARRGKPLVRLDSGEDG
jgi:hypothetical protein